MATYPVASDLSFEVLQRRAREFQLAPPALDSRNQILHALPSRIAQFEPFLAERPGGVSEPEWAERRLARKQRRLEG
jgi:hypothetical protein